MRKPLAIMATLLTVAVATSTAQARHSQTTWRQRTIVSLRHQIQHHRTMTWTYQRQAGVAPTYSRHREKYVTSVPFLTWIKRLWLHRQVRARRLASHRYSAGATGGMRAFAGPCLAAIIDQEDPSWSPTQWNTAGSGAYGLPQALPASKMATAGSDWRTNPYTQIRWMRGYTRGRYGSECAALAYKRAHGTY